MDSVAGNTHDALNEAQVLSPEDTAKAAGVDSIEDIPAKFRNEDGSLNQRALLNSYLNLEAKQGRDSSQEVSTEEGWEEKPKERTSWKSKDDGRNMQVVMIELVQV